ncbi:Tryptophan synthase beta chain [Desulfovibrio sp. X2]|uniref:tryptophan synthase subunit beta n=1 Tax=Desulfovibrio sp. X2 TaxID=941449 RepID=UPI000358C88B|nr:tryptophan synthase subunit beta [Desulfovibrio sp. X2]EPR36303.1 Tryptophan synthase beta chain [Desulfovibrio sp. X2]
MTPKKDTTPTDSGYYGEFGGRFVPELLMPPVLELTRAAQEIVASKEFQDEFTAILRDYVGRPSALYHCPNISRELGLEFWLKREDLNHTGAHKINNTIGQALLTKKMGKPRIIAETGAGQHGVATATAAAMLGLECVVYMGEIDVERQAHNVRRMELLGATVVPAKNGTKTLKDAVNLALKDWIANQRTTHYCIGSVIGPHPFPELVRDFQAVIGLEAKEQFAARTMGRLPDAVVACVGGGSNAMGMFHAFVPETSVRLIGVEAAGTGEPGCYHSSSLSQGTPGVFQGTLTKLLQTEQGQIEPSHSVAPGLDYPGVGPEHAWLQATGRAEYYCLKDDRALNAFFVLCRKEGIIPALESSHAVGWVLDNADRLPKGGNVIVCLSGRGDKDMGIVEEVLAKDPSAYSDIYSAKYAVKGPKEGK